MTYAQGKGQSTVTDPYIIPMLGLSDKDFKAPIINMLTEIKENMFITNE